MPGLYRRPRGAGATSQPVLRPHVDDGRPRESARLYYKKPRPSLPADAMPSPPAATGSRPAAGGAWGGAAPSRPMEVLGFTVPAGKRRDPPPPSPVWRQQRRGVRGPLPSCLCLAALRLAGLRV